MATIKFALIYPKNLLESFFFDFLCFFLSFNFSHQFFQPMHPARRIYVINPVLFIALPPFFIRQFPGLRMCENPAFAPLSLRAFHLLFRHVIRFPIISSVTRFPTTQSLHLYQYTQHHIWFMYVVSGIHIHAFRNHPGCICRRMMRC